MAESPFSDAQWTRMRELTRTHPGRYGLPERVYGSALIGSFNIRKLGARESRDENTWKWLARVCRRFDLIAIQEVQDELSGLRHLHKLIGEDFGLLVSDKTGAFPGEPGLGERLAFIYNRRVVRRTEIATDISIDRSKVLKTLQGHNDEIHAAIALYLEELAAASGGGSKPRLKLPTFLSFIRAPFCASFEITGFPGTEPYQIMVINAHLYFGDFMADRRQEFEALTGWIKARVNEDDKAYYPNFILAGDLNLDFDNPESDRGRIERAIKDFNGETPGDVNVNFPFLDPHPGLGEPFHTNARLNQTFDQIGLFARDRRLPDHAGHARMGNDPRGPDYGVFNFVELFREALDAPPVESMSSDERRRFFSRFEHKVSDHMPLWLRLPLPLEGESVA